MRQFFDGIALAQMPENHINLFNRKVSQSETDEIIPLISSIELDKKGGMAKISNWNSVE